MADTQQSGSSSSSQGGSNKDSGQKLSWSQPAGSNSQSNKPAGTANQLPPGSGGSSRTIGTFVAGLIIGLLIAWAWFDLRGAVNNRAGSMASSTDQFAVTQTGGTGEDSSSAMGSNSQGTVASGNSSVAVDGTPAAGTSVPVTVTTDTPVWAVVYAHSDGTGAVLGAARFGVSRSGSIDLIQPTVSGQTYAVGLVTDTANHQWGNHVDHQPVLGADGKQVMTTFTAQ